MPQLTIDVPEALSRQLARRAAAQGKSIEEVALEQLGSLAVPSEETPEERYERFFRESGLFRQAPEAEKQRDYPLSEAELKEVAARLGAAGPLSEVIIAERGEG
jgi:hypothetical protein